jgi:hypothetical protein
MSVGDHPYPGYYPNPNTHTWTLPPPQPSLVPDMTLRDYFAAQALGAIVSRAGWTPRVAADEAYSHADEMLKRRGRE